MKFGIEKPEKIITAFLLNSGCLQPFSLGAKNLYFNLLPILNPTSKNVLKFLIKLFFLNPITVLQTSQKKCLLTMKFLLPVATRTKRKSHLIWISNSPRYR